MDEKEKKPAPKFLEKLKKVKHIEIYIAIIFIVVLLLIFFSNFNKESKVTTQSETTITAYVENLQDNLEEILSSISGVSKVKVLITLDMSKASVTDSKLSLSTFPPLKGVIVTAKGVTDTATKLKVLHAIETAIDVTNGNVEILASE